MEPYTSPWRNEELDILRDAVTTMFEREFVPHDERWQKQGYIDREAWRTAGAAGILCASIPEEYGGGGATFAHEIVLVEAQTMTGAALGNSVHSGIAAHYIYRYGSEEQRQRWLPGMASGDLVCAIAMTEPGTGSDLQGVRTTALADGNEYLINGSKTFITNGFHADLVIVVAKTDKTEGAKGVSLVVVETKDAEGYRCGRVLEKIGLKAQDTAELFFDDVRVPAGNLLGGEEGQGFYQLMQQLPQERLLVASRAVASMERAIEVTSDYVKQRKAFGKTLLEFQNTRFKLAECKTKAHVARVFFDDLLMRHLTGNLDVATAAMAKWWTTETQCEIIDECLQLHGGYGYMLEYPIARMYADARVQKIYGGSNEIMKELVARAI
jgi:alkylation response protein AidB-like acyl-CoA dehydrogenase